MGVIMENITVIEEAILIYLEVATTNKIPTDVNIIAGKIYEGCGFSSVETAKIKVEETIKSLIEREYVSKKNLWYSITEKGISVLRILEQNRICTKRKIIINRYYSKRY